MAEVRLCGGEMRRGEAWFGWAVPTVPGLVLVVVLVLIPAALVVEMAVVLRLWSS